jgi:hypothetical protein
MTDKTDKQKILAALQGRRPESEPIEVAPGVKLTLRLVPAARKDALRTEAAAELPADAEEREDRVYGALVLRILAAALAHHGITLEEVREHMTAPVLKILWAEYERLEAVVAPSSDAELEALHAKVRALVGESRGAAVIHLSGLDYTTLLRFAISSVGRQSN